MENNNKNNNYCNEQTQANARNSEMKRLDSTGLKGRKTLVRKSGSKYYNDPMWYTLNEQLGSDVASLPYSYPTGMPLPSVDPALTSMPSVASVIYYPAFGNSSNASSAINVAARAVYAFVRHMNSGSKNYESPDLMLYILGMSDIYGQIFEAKRIYATALKYDAMNRAFPDVFLRAMKADPDSIRSNLAQFRYRLNQIILKANSLMVPATFNLFLRTNVLAQSIIADSTAMTGQFYLWQRAGYYWFDATGDSHGGRLRFIEYPNADLRTWEEILDTIDAALDHIIQDEECNIMSGDILKAYGESGVFQISQVGNEESVRIIHDENLLNMIENTYLLGVKPMNLILAQANGSLLHRPYIPVVKNYTDVTDETPVTQIYGRVLAGYLAGRAISINSHVDNPTWKDNIEFTSATVSMNYTPGDDAAYLNFSSEIPYVLRVFHHNDNGLVYHDIGALAITGEDVIFSDASTENVLDVMRTTMLKMTLLSRFDWHPIVLPTIIYPDNIIQETGPMFDSKRFTILSSETIARLRDNMTLGLYKTNLI